MDRAWRFHNLGPATINLTYGKTDGGTGSVEFRPACHVDLTVSWVALEVPTNDAYDAAAVDWELRTE